MEIDGDIIQIIVIIILLVVSSLAGALKKKKKPENVPGGPAGDQPPEEKKFEGFDPFKELFDQVGGSSPEPEPEPVFEEEEIELQAEQTLLEEREAILESIPSEPEGASKLETIPEEEGVPVFQKTRDELISDDIDLISDTSSIFNTEISDTIGKEEESNEIISEFDLKRGIIYHEILKRKHF